MELQILLKSVEMLVIFSNFRSFHNFMGELKAKC